MIVSYPRRVPFGTTLRALAIVFACAAALCTASPAFAQAAPKGLPTAPAADRAAIGGLTASRASLPGDGGSPLEPWLVSWLLPVSGLLSVAIAVAVDRRVRAYGKR